MARIHVAIPNGLLQFTLGNVSAGTLAKVNQWHTNRGGTAVSPGDDNPLFVKLLEYGLEGVVWKKGSGGAQTLAVAGPFRDAEFWSIGEAKFIVGLEGDVRGLPCWFPIAAANLNDEIPAEFPNRTWEDGSIDPENPVTTVHTWNTWYDGMPGHDPVELPDGGGTYYCSAANTWNRGRPIDASVWVAAGLNPIGVEAFKDLQPETP